MKQLLLLSLLLLALAACQQQEPEPETPPALLLTVGQRQLNMAQFNRELQRSYPDLQRLPAADQLPLKKQLVNRLIERELLLGEAARLDIRITPDELDSELLALRGSYSTEEFDRILQASGQTRTSWQATVKLRKLTEKVAALATGPLPEVSYKELKDYYWVNRDEFRRPLELRARQMLVTSLEEAELLRQRVKAGEDFAELARQHSLSPDREDGGNLGYFSKGQLPPEFDQVLFELSIGQVSEPVQSPYGYHLFLVEHRRRAGLRILEQVEDLIRQKLTQQRQEAAFQQWLEELRERVPVSVAWAQLTAKTAAH